MQAAHFSRWLKFGSQHTRLVVQSPVTPWDPMPTSGLYIPEYMNKTISCVMNVSLCDNMHVKKPEDNLVPRQDLSLELQWQPAYPW